jgi:ATP-dependent DNA ligase
VQNELKGRSKKIVLVAFDLLYLDVYDLRKLPLSTRKATLKKLIVGTDIQFSESFEVHGRTVFEHACKVGNEDVVSKVANTPYVSGCGRNCVKKPCAQRKTLTIAGFALEEGKWDGIYLGRRKGNELVYARKVANTEHPMRRIPDPEIDSASEPRECVVGAPPVSWCCLRRLSSPPWYRARVVQAAAMTAGLMGFFTLVGVPPELP